MSDSTLEKATGESMSGLAWMVAGAAAVAVFLAPLISKYLGISATFALILGGIALAYLGKGGLRKAGQGAAVFGIASFAMGYLTPIFGGLFGGAKTANKTADGVFI